MQNANSFEKLEEAWSNFLTMANRAYTKLEQGAKDNGKHRAWFGRQKHERRQDPLLRYIKNARDADEHGLERITERASGGIGINFPHGETKSTVVKRGHIGGGQIALEFEQPTEISVHAYPAGVKLIAVTNYGDRYEAPIEHLGQPIRRTHPHAHPSPIPVAELAISHLEKLIAEARNLEP